MGTIYGATVAQENRNESDLRYDVIGKNSEVFTSGDPVTITSNTLAVGGTTNSIVGVVVKTATMASDNETVAKVKPAFVPADFDTIFLMGANGDLTAGETGTYYKLTTATTATVQIDQASGAQTTTNRVVEIVKVDPFNEGGTGAGSGLRKALVRFVKTPGFNIPTNS